MTVSLHRQFDTAEFAETKEYLPSVNRHVSLLRYGVRWTQAGTFMPQLYTC